jgi:hypothetical protein
MFDFPAGGIDRFPCVLYVPKPAEAAWFWRDSSLNIDLFLASPEQARQGIRLGL